MSDILFYVDFQLDCPMWPVQLWRLQQPLHDLGGKLRVRVIGRRPEEGLQDTVPPFTSKPASFWTTSFRCRVATTLVVHPTLNTPQSGFTLLKVRESKINRIGIGAWRGKIVGKKTQWFSWRTINVPRQLHNNLTVFCAALGTRTPWITAITNHDCTLVKNALIFAFSKNWDGEGSGLPLAFLSALQLIVHSFILCGWNARVTVSEKARKNIKW